MVLDEEVHRATVLSPLGHTTLVVSQTSSTSAPEIAIKYSKWYTTLTYTHLIVLEESRSLLGFPYFYIHLNKQTNNK